MSQFTVRPKGSGGLNISFVGIPWIACVSAALSWAEVSWLTSSGIRIYFQIEARFRLPAFLSFLICSPEDYPFPHSVTPAQVRPEQGGKLPLGNCYLLHRHGSWWVHKFPAACQGFSLPHFHPKEAHKPVKRRGQWRLASESTQSRH